MAENSKIEWTDATFNPWIGCTKVSPACDFCYAEVSTPARTLRASGQETWGANAPRKRTSDANWREPLKWNRKAAAEGRRMRVFCASLADVFDNQVPDEWRADLFVLIRATPNLDWLLLTKRPQNIAKMLPPDWGAGYPNVWLGTTVENQTEADRRIPHLLNVPARVRFLSCEPLLGPVDLWIRPRGAGLAQGIDALTGIGSPSLTGAGRLGFGPSGERARIDWVIVGGESGPGARPMHSDWARSLRDQCAAAGVPFFFKQWGEWAPNEEFTHFPRSDAAVHEWLVPGSDLIEGHSWRYGKKRAGRLLDGIEHNGIPEVRGQKAAR